MRTTNIIKDLNGFLWESIKDISPEDFIEPGDKVQPSEQILGPMSDFEKAIFSIHEDILETILISFNMDEDSDEDVGDFYAFLLDSSKQEFFKKCAEFNVEVEEVLHLRSQFLSSYDFLHLITLQRFDLNYDDFAVFYREGFLVTIQNKNVLNASPY